jgi:hypothetical protein
LRLGSAGDYRFDQREVSGGAKAMVFFIVDIENKNRKWCARPAIERHAATIDHLSAA